MSWQRSVCVIFSIGGVALADPSGASAQLLVPPSAQSPPASTAPAGPSTSLEVALLRSLQANPVTASYGFSTERRGARIALRGRVGTKQVHDAAIRTAIALGVPVIDDLVIDTLAAHQAAADQSRMAAGPGMGYESAGPSSGLGGYPGAGAYGSLPYTYPQPLFGRLDDPFFGFEPPAISYPPWWGSLTAYRTGVPTAPASNVAPGMAAPNASLVNPPADPNAPQAGSLPAGTIDMAVDPRGVATLRGTVPSLGERITLGQKVAQTPGVTQVINLLNVDPSVANAVAKVSEKPPPPPVPADLTAAPRPAQAPDMANEGPAISTEADPVGLRAARAISSRAGLANPSVRVKVRDGVASLSGKVPTVYEAMLAFRAVQRTPGVREVEDRLEFVVPDGTGPNPLADKGRPEDVEPYLEAQIRRQVGDLAHLDRVRAQGDSLDLKGTLDREEDRPRFDAIIRSMPILRGFRINAEMAAESR